MRARITLAVVVLTSLAMGGAGLAAYVVEERRTERRILNSVTDEKRTPPRVSRCAGWLDPPP